MNRLNENQGEIPTELSELLSELQADRGVQLSLEVPQIRQRCYSQPGGPQKDQQGETRIPALKVERGRVTGSPAVVYRDAADVRIFLSLTWSMMILALLLVASGVGNIYQYLRRPDRIVVDGGTGRVLSINNRNYGSEVTDDKGQVTTALEKHVHPNFVIYAGHIATTSFARVLWHLWRLHGWNLKEIAELLDATYDKLHYNSELRFWHSPAT